MYFSGQATKLFLLFSVLGQRAPTRPKWLFVALVLEKTGEWGGSSPYVPALQKRILPGDLSYLHVSTSVLFLASVYSSLMCLFEKLAPMLEHSLEVMIHLINSK